MKFAGHLPIEDDVFDDEKLRPLASYVARQLDSMFPSQGVEADTENILQVLPLAIDRLKPVLRAVQCFNAASFDFYNSLQYTAFLYILANAQFRAGLDRSLSERLFCLNRALNSIDLFYSVELPEVFFVSHGLGTVLGNARYGNRLVVFQNVTVGRVGASKPVIGDNVVLYPGAVVTGKTVVGNNCVVSAGTILHNVVVPDNSVTKWEGGKVVFRENKKDYVGLYLG